MLDATFSIDLDHTWVVMGGIASMLAILAAVGFVLRKVYQTTAKIEEANDLLFGDSKREIVPLAKWQSDISTALSEAVTKQRGMQADVSQIKAMVLPNGGSSLPDQVTVLKEVVDDHIVKSETMWQTTSDRVDSLHRDLSAVAADIDEIKARSHHIRREDKENPDD